MAEVAVATGDRYDSAGWIYASSSDDTLVDGTLEVRTMAHPCREPW